MAKAAGFTYLGLLILIAIASVTLGATAIVWHLANQREREKDLLFIGTEFRRALASYADGGPGVGRGAYPRQLEDLVRDPRFPSVRRHLRQVYYDPMTNSRDWGLIRAIDGSIRGVYSRSKGAPIRKAGFPAEWKHFAEAKSYSDWVFRGGSTVAAAANPAAGQSARSTSTVGAATPATSAPGRVLAERGRANTNEQDCEALQAADLTACLSAAGAYGEEFGFVCQGTMPGRYAACLQKRRLPPLQTKP
jgi:type II secretory pathway pseudopilin PulG